MPLKKYPIAGAVFCEPLIPCSTSFVISVALSCSTGTRQLCTPCQPPITLPGVRVYRCRIADSRYEHRYVPRQGGGGIGSINTQPHDFNVFLPSINPPYSFMQQDNANEKLSSLESDGLRGTARWKDEPLEALHTVRMDHPHPRVMVAGAGALHLPYQGDQAASRG